MQAVCSRPSATVTGLIPYIDELTNSVFDIRNRFTLNGNYELPFGRGRAFLSNSSRWMDEVIGGWSSSLTYAAQTGTPFTVSPNISTARRKRARISGEGSILWRRHSRSDESEPDLMPCAGEDEAELLQPVRLPNPLPGETISDATHPVGSVNPDGLPVLFQAPVTDRATAIALLGSPQNNIYGPGYYQVNMSLFKSFPIWREQNLPVPGGCLQCVQHLDAGNAERVNERETRV